MPVMMGLPERNTSSSITAAAAAAARRRRRRRGGVVVREPEGVCKNAFRNGARLLVTVGSASGKFALRQMRKHRDDDAPGDAP